MWMDDIGNDIVIIKLTFSLSALPRCFIYHILNFFIIQSFFKYEMKIIKKMWSFNKTFLEIKKNIINILQKNIQRMYSNWYIYYYVYINV